MSPSGPSVTRNAIGRSTVGFVGLGDIGEPMAQRILAAGYDLFVFARREEQAARLLANGATWAPSLAALGAAIDVLCVCVGGDDDVCEVVDAASSTLRRGAVIVVHATVHPETCRSLATALAPRGIDVIDAPISGARQRAVDGDLTVIVGGDADAVERVRPILLTFGSNVEHVGDVGAGQMLKLLNNTIFAAQVEITGAVLDRLSALGIARGPAVQILATSTGASTALQWCAASGSTNAFPRHQSGRTHGATILAKDLRIARDAFDASGVEAGLLDAVSAAGLARAFAEGQRDDVSDAGR